MNYVVTETQVSSEDVVATITTAFQTMNEALAQYHQVLSAAATSSCKVHSAILFTDEGSPLRYDYFRHDGNVSDPEVNK